MDMKRYVIDIETDGFLNKMTTIHCLVIKDTTTKEVFVYRGSAPDYELEQGLDHLTECMKDGYIVGHNIIKFDIPALQKIYRLFQVNEDRVIDTLVLSRLIYTNLRDTDSAYVSTGSLPGKLWASHGLKAWGYRLGLLKGDLGEAEERFDVFTTEMLEYCKQDVEVTERLLAHLETLDYSKQAIEIEHKVAWICAQMERNGWEFDEAKAVSLYVKLLEKRTEIVKNMQEVFPPITIDRGVSEKTGRKLKDKLVEFNPGSRQHIAQRLTEKYNWVPKDFTPSGQVKVDEEVLIKLPYPEAVILTEYFLLNKRIAQIAEGDQAWLKLLQGTKIHGSINTNGAVTGRATHNSPNMAQVPSVSSLYGKECRELFKVSKGYKLVGCDLSGLELRCLAHFMAKWDGGAYGKTVVEGKQEDGTDIHTVNQKAAGLPTRANAKTFIYGFLYGAGDAKIGSIINKGAKKGKALKNEFLNNLPALGTLRRLVIEAAGRGYLIGLDGRKLHIRSSHAALNTLLQSAGALIAKQWLIEVEEACVELGYTNEDYSLVGFIHDETQWQVREEIADDFGKLVIQAAKTAGEYFKFKVPVGAEYSVGENWADTH
jgi:DNA polymerase-1